MDDLDQKILAALIADSSTSVSRLARRFRVARSTVQARLERLESNGTIAAYTIKLGNAAAVRRIRATLLLQVELRESAGVVQRLKAIPEVESLHATTGQWGLIASVAADSTESLDAVFERIGQMPGVRDRLALVHMATKFDRSV